MALRHRIAVLASNSRFLHTQSPLYAMMYLCANTVYTYPVHRTYTHVASVPESARTARAPFARIAQRGRDPRDHYSVERKEHVVARAAATRAVE